MTIWIMRAAGGTTEGAARHKCMYRRVGGNCKRSVGGKGMIARRAGSRGGKEAILPLNASNCGCRISKFVEGGNRCIAAGGSRCAGSTVGGLDRGSRDKISRTATRDPSQFHLVANLAVEGPRSLTSDLPSSHRLPPARPLRPYWLRRLRCTSTCQNNMLVRRRRRSKNI